MLSELLQFLFSGLTVGAMYALAAVGFSIIYSASGVINFAQGEFIMLGGMSAALLVQAGVPLPMAIALAVLVAAVAADLDMIAFESVLDVGLDLIGLDHDSLAFLILLCHKTTPSPSRGGLGWGWVGIALHFPHPHPVLPLEGEGTC